MGRPGILGLILGIVIRGIAENYLASLLLSVQRPFRSGGSILADGRTGLVLAATTRGTTMLTPDGNYVRIPNSTFYKSTIVNLTVNLNQRGDFTVPVDSKLPLSKVQQCVLKTVSEQEAVLASPEPLVLVDRMGRSVAIVRVTFCLNVQKYSKDRRRRQTRP